MSITKDLLDKKKSVAVIGLGYVGLPIALEFGRFMHVIGFDVHKGRIAQMQDGLDPSEELGPEDFRNRDVVFTADPEDLRNAHFFIIAVPTPIDVHTNPDLKPLLSATKTVGKVLKRGDYVVFESTVYPGCTEEDCVPILEKESGLTLNIDFKVGYSPERINPGDRQHTLTKVIKVVSGSDAEAATEIAAFYSIIVEPGVHCASSIKVAEAAKIIENTQRDLNIALMNELSIIFDRMKINTYEVLEAAGTKWNFLKFFPGLVGGHCIGVDPYYLTYKSKALGHDPKVIISGRNINDNMGGHIARKTVQKIVKSGTNVAQSRVLVMGATFKENVSDIRNSKVADVVHELEAFSVNVDVVDPHAKSKDLEHEYNFGLVTAPTGKYDAIMVCVAHTEYIGLTAAFFKDNLTVTGLLVDVKGIYRKLAADANINYWSL